jgi:hypothetical protein
MRRHSAPMTRCSDEDRKRILSEARATLERTVEIPRALPREALQRSQVEQVIADYEPGRYRENALDKWRRERAELEAERKAEADRERNMTDTEMAKWRAHFYEVIAQERASTEARVMAEREFIRRR